MGRRYKRKTKFGRPQQNIEKLEENNAEIDKKLKQERLERFKISALLRGLEIDIESIKRKHSNN